MTLSPESNRGDAQPGVLLEPRRGILAKAVALLAAAAAFATPAVAGLFSFFQPLREKAAAGQFLPLTTLDSLPDDGTPRKFPVVMDRTDAWNRFPNEPVGAVMLRRRPGTQAVEAISVVCPHAGCFVDYLSDRNGYVCPCHNGSFDLSGKRLDASSPSPRDLDTLAVEVRGQEVWVKYQTFRTGTPQKVADA